MTDIPDVAANLADLFDTPCQCGHPAYMHAWHGCDHGWVIGHGSASERLIPGDNACDCTEEP